MTNYDSPTLLPGASNIHSFEPSPKHMNTQLPLHQELMLLSLRDHEGTSIGCSYLFGVAGACLAELTLQKKVTISNDKKRKVTVIDSNPIGDEVLDEIITKISSKKRLKSATEWITAISQTSKLKQRIAEQLCDKGILRLEEKTILWFFTSNRYPEVVPKWERALKQRMAKLMFGQSIRHDERTTIVIALAKATQLLRHNFDRDRLARNKDRINRIAKGDMFAARATQDAIAMIQAAIMVATVIPTVTASSG